MASVSAPEAFSAKFSARRASAAPNADAARAYRLRAPTGLPSAFSGRARQDRIPCEAAWASNSGRQHGHLVQELLDALGAEQGAVQILEIPRVGAFRCDIFSAVVIHRHTHLVDTRPAPSGIIFGFDLLPLASKSNVAARGAGRDQGRHGRGAGSGPAGLPAGVDAVRLQRVVSAMNRWWGGVMPLLSILAGRGPPASAPRRPPRPSASSRRRPGPCRSPARRGRPGRSRH